MLAVALPDTVLALPRAVDYWYGAGSGAPLDPVGWCGSCGGEPAVVNALAVPVGTPFADAPAGFRSRAASGSRQTGRVVKVISRNQIS